MKYEVFCAQDWIRTSTPLRALRPEHSASTNFATWAFRFFFRSGKDRRFRQISKEVFIQSIFPSTDPVKQSPSAFHS